MGSSRKQYNVTVIGGGTGSFTLLTGLKNYPDIDLAAVVAMTDSGGSTGLLRDELGALPPGDIRQCLVALSRSEDIWRRLFTYRFTRGGLKGHNFGNLFISALEQITGSFEESIDLAGQILQVQGQVIPVTLDDVRLVAITSNGKRVFGEHQIDLKKDVIKDIYFRPIPTSNPKALERILRSDLIVINPGDVYTSTLPVLLVPGVRDVLSDSSARKVYVFNVMTQPKHTSGFRVIDFVELLESKLGKNIFDTVLYNTKKPSAAFVRAYAKEGEHPVSYRQRDFKRKDISFIGADLLGQKIPQKVVGDTLSRALVRHDSYKTAHELYKLLKD